MEIFLKALTDRRARTISMIIDHGENNDAFYKSKIKYSKYKILQYESLLYSKNQAYQMN